MAEKPPPSSAHLSSFAGPLQLPVPRDLVRSAAHAALAAAWRGMRPNTGERFTRAPEKRLLSRLYYRADDGWQAPLFRLEPRPGAPGEPVVLAHGLGVNRHCLDFDPKLSLARTLNAEGYAVYLLEHRGDRSAIAPPKAPSWDFDDLATRDIPAALDAVRAHSGAARVLYVGHGLGGQLLYAHLAHSRGEDIAGACSISAPVRFTAPTSQARALRKAARFLPGALRLPTRAASAMSATSLMGEGLTEGPVHRGLLVHASEDLHVGLLRQVLRWFEAGALVDRDDRIDYACALHGLKTPIQLVTSWGDPLCRPEDATPVLSHLAGPSDLVELDASWNHLDPLLGKDAPSRVYSHIVRFLGRFREACW
ncbi:MAG TPA: alpha/beta hydrolase [Myxococcota bacterium]|nr:alpha/beta hydrolase [Myxococcota bacterium]